MLKRKTDPVERLKAIRALSEDDVLDMECPDSVVDEVLRHAGGDPDLVGSEGQTFVARLVKMGREASTTRLRTTTETQSSAPPVGEKSSDSRGELDDPE